MMWMDVEPVFITGQLDAGGERGRELLLVVTTEGGGTFVPRQREVIMKPLCVDCMR